MFYLLKDTTGSWILDTIFSSSVISFGENYRAHDKDLQPSDMRRRSYDQSINISRQKEYRIPKMSIRVCKARHIRVEDRSQPESEKHLFEISGSPK